MTSGTIDASTIHKAAMLQKRALVELHDTELHKLLDRPNPAQSYNSWLTELISFGKLNRQPLHLWNWTRYRRERWEIY